MKILEIVDASNEEALDLDNRDPELAVPLLEILADLKGDDTDAICFFGSISAGQQLASLLSECRPGMDFKVWRFPVGWRDRAEILRTVIGGSLGQKAELFCRLNISVEKPFSGTPSAVSDFFAGILTGLFVALDEGHLPRTGEMIRALGEAAHLVGDIGGELSAHAGRLLGLVSDERTVFFPSVDETTEIAAVTQAFAVAQLATQFCSEGIFRFELASGHDLRVSGLPYGQARANVLGALAAMKAGYKTELSNDELGDVAIKILMLQVEFLRARSRYEFATQEFTVAFAFLYRAFELFLVTVLASERVVTVSNAVLLYDGSTQVNGTGAVLYLARKYLKQFLTNEQREALEAAVEMRNKCLLGHQLLSIPRSFFSKIAASLNTALIEFAKYKGLSQHRKALREATFGPECLKHHAAFLCGRFLSGRQLQVSDSTGSR
jgi:hypothetical protein